MANYFGNYSRPPGVLDPQPPRHPREALLRLGRFEEAAADCAEASYRVEGLGCRVEGSGFVWVECLGGLGMFRVFRFRVVFGFRVG